MQVLVESEIDTDFKSNKLCVNIISIHVHYPLMFSWRCPNQGASYPNIALLLIYISSDFVVVFVQKLILNICRVLYILHDWFVINIPFPFNLKS
jgi:hypothetical protein